MPRDVFLKNIYDSEDGWVGVDTISSFKGIVKYTTDLDVVKAAIKQSTFLKLNEDESKVTRVTPLPAVEDLQAKKQNILHVRNLPTEVALDEIQTFFAQPKFGLNVQCVRMSRDKEKKFKVGRRQTRKIPLRSLQRRHTDDGAHSFFSL